MNLRRQFSSFSVDGVGSEKLLDLVNTLIQMLVVQLEKPQSAQVLPFETLTPWILLHRMLAHEEQLQRQAEGKQEAAVGGELGLRAKAEVSPLHRRIIRDNQVHCLPSPFPLALLHRTFSSCSCLFYPNSICKS